MSELDADLYGDLYANDDGEFHDPSAEEKDAQQPPVEQSKTSDPRTAPSLTADSSPAPKPTPTDSTTATSQHSVPPATTTTTSANTGQAAPIAVPSFSQPVTQQIPTYEQPQPSDYSISGRNDGSYQNIPINERTVRPSEMKDEGKMFIGGLNWDTTDDALRDYFSQFGKVDACTIMRDAAGRSRCFAFLTFEDPASVNAVMVREHFLDGKIIDPKRAIPRQEHQRATKLFIGGLAGSVTSESMREFFSQYGKVIDSTVMLDRETGRSKGFGFVSFEDTNVQPFLGFGNLEIDGKLIDVKLAQPRYQRDSYPNEDGQGGGGDYVQATSGRFGGGQQTNFGNAGAGATMAGNAPFDPQALAALYTRMFQMAGGVGQMNPAMMGAMGGGMNPMMNAMGGGFGGMRPAMGMGVGTGMGMGMGAGAGAAGNSMGGMGRGSGPAMMANGGGGAMNPNIPRGPRGGPGGPATPTGPMGNASVGPQRTGQRGQHNFHPYAR